MTAMTSESVTDALDDEFDLDIRIEDLGPADPDRIYRAQTQAYSCSICCPTTGCDPTVIGCISQYVCTGTACN
jgi:hypothetical protein